jgi:hypothetical protein
VRGQRVGGLETRIRLSLTDLTITFRSVRLRTVAKEIAG